MTLNTQIIKNLFCYIKEYQEKTKINQIINYS